MKYRILAAVVLLIALFSCITLSSAPMVEDTVAHDAQKKFNKIIEKDKMNGAVYAVCNGEEIYDKGIGEAAKGVENTTDTVFAVASVTKQFTAAAIMKLYEEGKLDLDDTLDKYFPDYKYGKNITLRLLLCQRSGIPDYSIEIDGDRVVSTCDGDSSMKDAVEVEEDNSGKTNRELIRDQIFSRKLLFKPGERFDYSDANYALLAEVIPIVSKVGYHDYIIRNFFEPFGMTRSAFIDYYDFGDDVVIAQPDHVEFEYDYTEYYGVEYGCGDIMLSPKDLYKWYKALFSGEVVSKESLDLMTKNYSSKDELGYGFGLMISDTSDTKVAYHYGWIPSFYSSVFYIPEIDYFQAVLSNRSTGNPQQVSAQLATAFAGIKNIKLVDIE